MANQNTREFKGSSLIDFVDDYFVVDIETTGLSPKHDQIIELAAIRIQDKEIIDTFSTLVKPSCRINDFIISLTGIDNEMVASAPSLKDILPEYLDFIGDAILVGHNIHFDINFLYDNCIRILNRPFPNDFVDTLRLSRNVMKSIKNYKLKTIAECLNIGCLNKHRALDDCVTVFKCFESIKSIDSQYYEEIADSIVNSLKESEKYDDVHRMFNSKYVSVKGSFSKVDYETIIQVLKKLGAKPSYALFKRCKYLITSNRKAANHSADNGLNIINEDKLIEIFNIPTKENRKIDYQNDKYLNINRLNLSDILTNQCDNTSHPLYGKTCVFTGALQRMERSIAAQIVSNIGGICSNTVTKKTDYLVLGNYDYCYTLKDNKSSKRKKAEEYVLAGIDISIISEEEFYDMIEEA